MATFQIKRRVRQWEAQIDSDSAEAVRVTRPRDRAPARVLRDAPDLEGGDAVSKNERALADLDRITNVIKESMSGGWRTSWERKSLQNIRRALLTAAIIDPVEPPTGWYTFGTHTDIAVDLEFYGEDAGLPLWERPIS